MAKPKKYNLYSRLFHVEKLLGDAQKTGSTKEVDAIKARIDNTKAMLKDDYDYWKFSSGGLSTKISRAGKILGLQGKLAKKYVNPVTIVDHLKNKKWHKKLKTGLIK